VAERAEPLVAAVEAHVRNTGPPPATIQDRVPRYLAAIPSGLPNITIAAGETAPADVRDQQD
jgi:hypothetical protein